MDWRHEALCRNEDPSLFFPEGDALAERDAKEVCDSCPVESNCLNWALDTGQDHGVLGGLNENERRAMKQLERLRVRTL